MSVDSDKKAFIDELESMLESDDTYGSNVQILTYKPGDTITGRFKDSWNNRVFDFSVDVDNGITYKPAVNLDSCSSDDELISRFDSFSDGFNSGFVSRDDGKLTGKRTKKPKCGATAYGCGYGCIGVKKTCKIGVAGKKLGTNQGANIGKERIEKLMKMGNAISQSGGDVSGVASKLTEALTAKGAHASEGRDRLEARREAKAKTEPKTEIVAEMKPIAEVKKARKTSTKKATNPKPPIEKKIPKGAKSTTKQAESTPSPDPTKNPNTHSIKTQKDFEDVILHVTKQLNDKNNYDNLIPINEIREAIGELVPRDKFNKFVEDMQANDKIQLMGGEQPNRSPDAIQNSIVVGGNRRNYLSIMADGENILKKTKESRKSQIEKMLKDRPKLDPLGTARAYTTGTKIQSQKEFNSTVDDVVKSLDRDFIHENYVPISKVREVLKDRISSDDFNKMMGNIQEYNGLTLHRGASDMENEVKKGGIDLGGGLERHYVSR